VRLCRHDPGSHASAFSTVFYHERNRQKALAWAFPPSKAIVKGHSGFAESLTEAGKRTTFKITAFHRDRRFANRSVRRRPTLAFRQGEQILVVDDEIAVLEMKRETSKLQLCVLMAKNGAEAVVRLSTE